MEEQPGSLLPEGWGGMPAHLPDPAHALQPYLPLTHQGPGSKLRMSVLVNSYSSVKALLGKASYLSPPCEVSFYQWFLKHLHCVRPSCS